MKVVTTAITVTAHEHSNVGSATARCADGDVAISGGVSTQTDGWSVRASNPSSTDSDPTGWFGEIVGNDDGGHHGDGSIDGSSDSKYTSSNGSDGSHDGSDDGTDDDGTDDDGNGDGSASGTVYVLCMTP